MKNTKILLFTALFIALSGCKNNPDKTGDEQFIEESTAVRLPNKSDKYFADALDALDKNDKTKAVNLLEEGIAAVRKEGKDAKGPYQVSLHDATITIERIAKAIKDNKSYSLTQLKEAILNAEISISHDYLVSTDVYVLTKPDMAKANQITKRFNNTVSNLKKEAASMDNAGKKEGHALLKEGENLEKEFIDWQQKVRQFNQKANEHFKNNSPEYYEEDYIW